MKNEPSRQQYCRPYFQMVLLFLLVASSVVLPGSSLSRAARTGVLIHGCHLGAKGWRSVMWGNEEKQQLGRLPHGARLAWEENACVVVLGTGASELDGVVEGRYALEYLKRNWGRLREFDKAFAGVDLDEMSNAVEPLLVAEVRSQNTWQELKEAGRIFRKEKCDRVILVSSPTHLPRCLRDACSLWLDYEHQPPSGAEGALTDGEHAENSATTNSGGQGDDGRLHENGDGKEERRRRPSWVPLVLASPSDTSYAGYGPEDVAIVEPPHRGDHDWGSGGRTTGDISNGGPGSAPIPGFPEGSVAGGGQEVEEGALVARDLSQAEEATAPLLHHLVGLALRVRESSDEVFRKELQELLRRYVDMEQK
eukprot:g9966.t1